jgi:diguanylate cyclase (GGDEF)-like protein
MTRKRASPDPLFRTRPSRAQREACLVVLYGTELGKRVALPQSTFTIGRATKADLQIDQEAVSRRHARIEYSGARHTILDLRSSNGVFVNEVRVTERKLEDGDRIRIGRTLLVFMTGLNVEARYQDELHRLMTADPLTQVYNKRYFHEALEREHSRATRGEGGLSLLLFDVDGWGGIQSAHGQLAADAALRQLAAAVKLGLRPQDVLGRLTEGSFGVILPQTDLAGARTAAEEVRVLAGGVPVVGEGASRMCTVSLGIATMHARADNQSAEDLLVTARAGLAEATSAGGNRVGGHGPVS